MNCARLSKNFFPLLLIVFCSALAVSTGWWYSLNGQINPVWWVTSGGGYSIETGWASINQNSQWGSYTLFGGAFRSQPQDIDFDGIIGSLEDGGLNGGDGNGDGILDSQQSHVVTLAWPNTTHAVALEVISSDCDQIVAFGDTTESLIGTPDPLYTYPVGLIDFWLECGTAGQTANVRVYFDADYSSTFSTWVFRKWNGTAWGTLTPQPTLGSHTFTTGPLAWITVTTATYFLTDGGLNDADGNLDTFIFDPLGPGISTVITPPSWGGWGGGGGWAFDFITKPFTSAPVCAQNIQWWWYRRCELGSHIDTFPGFADNVSCEWFIVRRDTLDGYEFLKNTPRKETLGIAVKMNRRQWQNLSIVEPGEYSNIYGDIGNDTEGTWIPGIVETALKHNMISRERTLFEPDREVTRAEAYAMIMSAVCLTVPEAQKPTYASWQEGIYDLAQSYWLTQRTWQNFEPQRSILRQELFVLASRAADWAEVTGGCDPKPTQCLRQKSIPISNISPDTIIPSNTQLPGTFLYLYDTDYHQVYSYIIKSGGIADGVRQAYLRTFGGAQVTANRLSVRDIAGNYHSEDQRFLPGEIVYVYLRKVIE